ncbi:hypothetical protein M407DRAFT_31700 [Tulasnella calospora MUT 4182]|uniref:F-box domain-containing protein n=1 Tax=Tulasnella calospora MUT 4182 TaxID=1051891 RepID=A0A0C3LAY0_9AGAM|nr:hypothetical protein M407DRAFT_31700 [Tulasnella calospora MUT 4182]
MKSTLRIISIVQVRVDAFLKEIFDLCESFEDSTAKGLSDTIATEIALYDTVVAAVRRRRNERTLFSRLATDIVHSIFGIALDVDRIHDPDLPSDTLGDYRPQLFRMRRVSSAWNNFLLSSLRYWQAIDISRGAKAITSVIERSGSARLCIYSFAGPSQASSIRLVPAARVQTLRSDQGGAYHLCRQFLQNPMPALQTLELHSPLWTSDDPSGPFGNLPSIRHLKAHRWQPPADAAWLTGLKALDMHRYSEQIMDLLQILSACANLEQLCICYVDKSVVGELPGAISPITLPRLQSIDLTFQSNESMVELTRRLVAPQCIRRTLHVDGARDLGLYVADYRGFMSGEERCIGQYPESAAIQIGEDWKGDICLDYKTKSRQVNLTVSSAEEVPAFRDLVQELQTLFNGPLLTATVWYPSKKKWLWLKSFDDQTIQTIVARLSEESSDACDFLKAIGARPADLQGLDGPVTNSVTNWPFKSLRSIEIHDAPWVDLSNFIELVEKHRDEGSKPLLKDIVLVRSKYNGYYLDEAVERLEEMGITLRYSVPGEAQVS